jgi:hypothetical protein
MSAPPTLASKNPFPAEAVVSFGTASLKSADLTYMRNADAELTAYIRAHPLENLRYGGAIGVRGGHGSGKTHLLTWLAGRLQASTAIRGAVLYGKCDSSRLSDLYRQLMQQLPRSEIVNLIQLALLNLARAKFRSAAVTESLADRLEDTGALQALQAEENLDLEQLRMQLLGKLEADSAGTEEMVRILLDIPSPGLGADAYQWLVGGEVSALAKLGVTKPLLRSRSESDVSNDVNAISALEVIAALHRLAGVPLLVLVDQLEVLLRSPTAAEFNQIGSLIKKFVEQLSRQSALTFIAGTPEAWKRLPPDVKDRLRIRDPLPVGSLTVEEVEALLNAYVEDQAELGAFQPEAVSRIRQLSGGSPREALRIAYKAFEASGGQLSAITDEVLLTGARDSGSIEERARTALAIADQVFDQWGTVLHDVVVGPGSVERTLLDSNGRTIAALLLVKATDFLDEVASAKRVAAIRSHCQEQWPNGELLIVAVGYSSGEVRDSLSDAIVFEEETLGSTLTARLAEARSRPDPAKEEARRAEAEEAEARRWESERHARTLNEVVERLERIERERRFQAESIARRVTERTEALSQPAQAERVVTTRAEISEALEVLQEALDREDRDRERSVIRSILIGNETSLHSGELAQLGQYYREVLSLDRMGGLDYSNLVRERIRLINQMRRTLNSGPLDILFNTKYLLMALASSALAFFITGIISSSNYERLHGPGYWLPPPQNFIQLLPYLFGVLGSLFLYLILASVFRDLLRRNRFRRRMEELESGRSVSGSIRDIYPQA